VGNFPNSLCSASPRQKTSPKAQRTATPVSVEYATALFDFSPNDKSISIRLDFCRAIPDDNSLRQADDQ
jgi:hypothetical protein